MKQEFINKVAPKAIEANRLYNIKSSLTISQAIIESGWGKSGLTQRANNLFGIKWYEGCGYDFEYGKTKEYINGQWITVTVKFKKYDSWDDSIEDHTNLLLKDRYTKVRTAKDYLEATQFIKECGYATSPDYPKTLRTIIEKYKLYQLDNGDILMNANDNLTKNFKYKEFFCQGIEPPADYFNNVMQCAEQLQKVRDIIKKPIIITSGYRTKQYNAQICGAKKSQHLTASAVDSHAKGLDIRIYHTYLVRYTLFNGFCIGTGKSPYNLIHADLRDKFWVAVYK